MHRQPIVPVESLRVFMKVSSEISHPRNAGVKTAACGKTVDGEATILIFRPEAWDGESRSKSVRRRQTNAPQCRLVCRRDAAGLKATANHEEPTSSVVFLIYGLEVCPLTKSDLKSLDFPVNRFFL